MKPQFANVLPHQTHAVLSDGTPLEPGPLLPWQTAGLEMRNGKLFAQAPGGEIEVPLGSYAVYLRPSVWDVVNAAEFQEEYAWAPLPPESTPWL